MLVGHSRTLAVIQAVSPLCLPEGRMGFAGGDSAGQRAFEVSNWSGVCEWDRKGRPRAWAEAGLPFGIVYGAFAERHLACGQQHPKFKIFAESSSGRRLACTISLVDGE